MSPITTHILDTAKGQPAAGIAVTLELMQNGQAMMVAKGVTDEDGRIMQWSQDYFSQYHQAGHYKITFDTDAYHHGKGFFPQVVIPFKVTDAAAHYHVPLLLSPFSYSTYRGS